MANIQVSVPDAVINRVLDAFATQYGWKATSGLTKAQFARRVVADFVKAVVKGYEARLAADAARVTAEANADTDIVIN
jgi:hypothetical protein